MAVRMWQYIWGLLVSLLWKLKGDRPVPAPDLPPHVPAPPENGLSERTKEIEAEREASIKESERLYAEQVRAHEESLAAGSTELTRNSEKLNVYLKEVGDAVRK